MPGEPVPMRSTHIIPIEFPKTFITPGLELPAGMSKGDLEFEVLVPARKYGDDVTKTLEERCIGPQRKAYCAQTTRLGMASVGIDTRGVLKEKYTERFPHDDLMVETTVTPTRKGSYEEALQAIDAQLKAFKQLPQDEYGAMFRTGPHGLYIEINSLIALCEQAYGETLGHAFPVTKIGFADEQGTKKRFDHDITRVNLASDPNTYTRLSDRNAWTLYHAMSLCDRVNAFGREVRKFVVEHHGIDTITETQRATYAFRDGSVAEFVFVPETRIPYGEFFEGLVRKKTKSISGTTGDLAIVRELAFEKEYQNTRGKHVHVETELTPHRRDHGDLLITAGNDCTKYAILRAEGHVYVSLVDVRERLKQKDALKAEPKGVKLYTNFFPKPPQVLTTQDALNTYFGEH